MLAALVGSFIISIFLATDFRTPRNHVLESLLWPAYGIFIARVIVARWLDEKNWGFIFYAAGILALPFICIHIAKPFDNPEMIRLYLEQNQHRWDSPAEPITGGNAIYAPSEER